MLYSKYSKDEPITEKQKKFIENIMDFAEPTPPEFKGTTKKEASLYISKYAHRVNSDAWCTVNGYD